jgi:hypothetical protein
MKMTQQIAREAAMHIAATIKAPDYSKLAHDEVYALMLARLPPKVLALFNDPETRDFIKYSVTYQSGTANLQMYPLPGYSSDKSLPEEARDAYTKYSEMMSKHINRKQELQNEAKNSLLAFKTVKQAVEALPKLAKYLPDITVPNPLPLACVNVMEKLRAAGFVEA